MTQKDREIQRRLRILKHAEETGHVGRTCRYFGIGRASVYRWTTALEKHGEAGLVRRRPIPKNPKNRTPPEIVEKVLYLRKTYHLGPMRIVWYLARYLDIKISAARVSRILKRNGLNHLPRGTRLRKVHTTRYQQQVPGHQIQVDIKFLIFRGKDGKPIKRCQYTAIDDATRVRALKVYNRHTHAYIKPRSPQLNGKVERSHRTDEEEFYQLLTYKDDVDLEDKLAHWERFYNLSRPHGAFNGKAPHEALREKL